MSTPSPFLSRRTFLAAPAAAALVSVSKTANGYSAEEMKALIANHLATYPLCQKARVEVIA